jgi:peroxiredoxin (alkyl hydroperoxide reductase subunit C)
VALAPGTPAPDFTLKRADGTDFTRADLEGRFTVLVFFPNAFSPVCTDQFLVYDEALPEMGDDVALYGVSTDQTWSQGAFSDQLGVAIEFLSDHEPKGAASKGFDAYFAPAGFSDRVLIITGPDAVVAWSHHAANPGELPGVNLVFDGLAAARRG